MTPEFTYNATVVKVIDGDTVDFLADLGFNVATKIRTRLYGIDTPEGKSVREIVRNLLPAHCKVVIRTFKAPNDKYGRRLAAVWLDGVNINEHLVAVGHARPYFGEKK